MRLVLWCLLPPIVLSFPLVGCARDGDPGAAPTPAATGPSSIWIAGLRVADDPNELDAETQEVKEAVGAAIAVAPVACFGGVPPAYEASAYVLGVVADSRQGVEDLLATLGREPLFVAQVVDLCVH